LNFILGGKVEFMIKNNEGDFGGIVEVNDGSQQRLPVELVQGDVR
jgi:hypothetical protein